MQPALNDQQRAAVRHVKSPLLVVAGAGSGKTRVITRKVRHLVRSHGFNPQQICALTFTNKAAREMQDRLATELKDADGRPRICTFHRLGLAVTREHFGEMGLRAGYTLANAADSVDIVGEALAAAGMDRGQAGVYQSAISRLKNDCIGADAADEQADLPPSTAAVYLEYERLLRSLNLVDFDDLILLPMRLLETDQSAKDAWRERIRYLLIDEYQDTNEAQYRLMMALVRGRTCLTAVGDDSQSIYAWRGARPENLHRLVVDLPDLEVIKLEQNYRSARNILAAANALIGQNPAMFPKRLWSEFGTVEPIKVLAAEDDEDEAESVAAAIAHRRVLGDAGYGDFAVLYRSNHLSRPLERALRSLSLPYAISGQLSFFDLAEVRDLLGYLKLVTNPDNDTAFLRIANRPRREMGARSLERLSEFAANSQCSLLCAACDPAIVDALPRRSGVAIHSLARALVTLADSPQQGPLQVFDEILEVTSYRDWVASSTDDPKDNERRQGNIQDLRDLLARMQYRDGEKTDLADIMSRLALADYLENQDANDAENAVQMMSLHAAKGLEFPHVFIVGFEEDLLPHRNSGEAGIEEERRLAYVGITRAKRTLTLSYCRTRKRYGERQDCVPSRFLDELPRDELAMSGEAEQDYNLDSGRKTLSGLKALLED